MAKYFTYFHLNRGLGPELREELKVQKRKRLRAHPLRGVTVDLNLRNIRVHLYESRYDRYFVQIVKVLARDNVPVYDVEKKDFLDLQEYIKDHPYFEVVEEEKPAVKPPVVLQEAPETPTKVEGPVEVLARPKRPLTAPILFAVDDQTTAIRNLPQLIRLTDKTANLIEVRSTLPVQHIPPEAEIRFSFTEVTKDPAEYRAAVTDRVEILDLGIQYAFPVVFLGTAPKRYDGFYTEAIDEGFLRLPIKGQSLRQDLFGSVVV